MIDSDRDYAFKAQVSLYICTVLRAFIVHTKYSLNPYHVGYLMQYAKSNQ